MRFATQRQADALAQLQDHPADVIITDIQMPGMGGAELLARVHERHPRRSARLSGYANTQYVARAATVAPHPGQALQRRRARADGGAIVRPA